MDGRASGRLLLRLAAREFQAEHPDYKKAFEFNLAAAKLGEPCACFNMGYLYENGLGIETDLEAAIYWYEMASQDGMKNAWVKSKALRKRLKGETAE